MSNNLLISFLFVWIERIAETDIRIVFEPIIQFWAQQL